MFKIKNISIAILSVIMSANILYGQDVNSTRLFYDDSASVEILSRLITIAWENYPKNRVFQHLLNHAEEKKFQQKLSWLNTLNITWQYNPVYEGSQEDIGIFPRFGLGLVLNLGSVFFTPSRVAQAEEEIQIAKANLDTQKNYIQAEVTWRYFKYVENMELLEVHTQAAEDSELVMNLVRNRFANGEVNLETYTRALGMFTSGRENLTKTKGKVMESKYSLEEILGTKLKGII